MVPSLDNVAALRSKHCFPMSEHHVPDECFSEPAAVNPALQKLLSGRNDLLNAIPSVPTILQSLLAELGQEPEDVNLLRVADLIGRDKSLAAQCLRKANSALFGRGRPTDSLRGAVRTLGIAHTREVAVSATMMRLGSAQTTLDPVVFWEHSLRCAIVSCKLARTVGFGDPEKAYLAGLLHDLGYVVNLILLPQQTKAAIEKGIMKTGVFMGESEYEDFGFTHTTATSAGFRIAAAGLWWQRMTSTRSLEKFQRRARTSPLWQRPCGRGMEDRGQTLSSGQTNEVGGFRKGLRPLLRGNS
jgi:HDOD domain